MRLIYIHIYLEYFIKLHLVIYYKFYEKSNMIFILHGFSYDNNYLVFSDFI